MRAKTAPAGRETSEMERLAKEPGRCSTRRRRVRSGWTQAGIWVLGVVDEGVMMGFADDFTDDDVFPFDDGGGVEVIAAGDIVGVE